MEKPRSGVSVKDGRHGLGLRLHRDHARAHCCGGTCPDHIPIISSVAQLHLKLKKGDTLPYTEVLPTIDGDEIKNSKGELYTLVHQYDRNEELKQLIENKYK